jgi:glucose-1-phosphate thymidylyltransferase
MKGIVLAGGTGSRLWPITRGVSKQLLPVYDKPLIFYPISTLMSAGIRDISIITTPIDQENYRRLLGDGNQYGVTFRYFIQEYPDGLAQAFLITREHIFGEKCALILGDNIFHGPGLGSQLRNYLNVNGAQVFAYQVSDPKSYGVVEFSEDGKVVSIEEKPANPRSKFAIPGLYFYDENIVGIAESISPSQRGELEISSVNQKYLENDSLNVGVLQRGTAWFDTGTFSSLHDASSYVRTLEERQGLKIGCLEEIAFRNNWIDRNDILKLADDYKSGTFSDYLRMLANG